jgi:hypothetical protein
MNPFDEMDGIMRAYVLLLRQANLEKRVMESALTQIANGCKDPQRIAKGTLETVGKVREHETVETPEVGLVNRLAEFRDVSERLRNVSERILQGAVDGSVVGVPSEPVHDS